MVGVCFIPIHVRMSTFHMYGRVYTYSSTGVWPSISFTHNIHEAPNLISTFVLMLIIIILSFVDWRHGGGVFHTCENELNFHMYGRSSVKILQVFGPQFHTQHP